jgi:hypothetical protein
MPYRSSDHVLDIARAPREDLDETSDERFDRSAFARRALELVEPARTTVAICEGAARMRVEQGRVWGAAHRGEPPGPPRQWAMLAIPSKASRRAIALAVAELAQRSRPYVLDVLLRERVELGQDHRHTSRVA